MTEFNMSPDSRVWVYSTNREFSSSEITYLESILNDFVADWNAHGAGLDAKAKVLHNRFLVFVVDESKVPASGCSIDKSVGCVKHIEKELNIDLFNRTNIWIKENGLFKNIHFGDLSIYKNSMMFNPMVTTLKELNENWFIPISSSSFVSS